MKVEALHRKEKNLKNVANSILGLQTQGSLTNKEAAYLMQLLRLFHGSLRVRDTLRYCGNGVAQFELEAY